MRFSIIKREPSYFFENIHEDLNRFLKDTFGDIEFIDYKIVAAEDSLFNMKYFSHVRKAYYEKQYYYHYRKNDSSLTRSYNERLFSMWDNLILYMKNEINKMNLEEEFSTAVLNRRCLSLIPLGLNAIYKSKHSLKEVMFLLNDEGISYALKKLKIKSLPLVWKVFFLSAKYKIYILFYILLKVISFKIH